MSVAEEIRSQREAIWLKKPDDIGRMWHREGARGQHFTTFVQAEGWTRILADEIHSLRQLARDPTVELDCLKRVSQALLESPIGRLMSYHLVDATKMVGYASSVIPDAKDHAALAELFEETELYLARLNYWIDSEIPYEPCGAAFEAAGSASVAP